MYVPAVKRATHSPLLAQASQPWHHCHLQHIVLGDRGHPVCWRIVSVISSRLPRLNSCSDPPQNSAPTVAASVCVAPAGCPLEDTLSQRTTALRYKPGGKLSVLTIWAKARTRLLRTFKNTPYAKAQFHFTTKACVEDTFKNILLFHCIQFCQWAPKLSYISMTTFRKLTG